MSVTGKLIDLEYRLALNKQLARGLYNAEFYQNAMFHQLKYLQALDEYNDILRNATEKQVNEYYTFGLRLGGIL